MSKVIGIDLGTTNSCVSVVENNQAVIIPTKNGARTTPSIVAFSKTGERLVGEDAKRQAVTNPDRTISSIKREMGTNWTKNIDGKEYKPQSISAMILMQLKKEAEDFVGEPITEAVITVPAYFNDVQRQATKDAGKIAGLNVKRIINEPTSAALSYGLDHGEPQKVMVYDLGGGTFDVSIIEIGEDVIEVLATAGNNHLGGDDFDKKLTDFLVSEIKKTYGADVSRDYAALQRVKEAAETAKKELSSLDVTHVVLPYLTQYKGAPVNADITISRAQFEYLISNLVDMTAEPVKNAIRDAGISTNELSKVLLVGGSTRVPLVQKKVKQLTGKEPSKNINPDECVAQGAAILGSTLSGNAIVTSTGSNNLLLLDVIPLSLSIETIGGVATRLIERNTTLPTKYSQIFTTAAPYQSAVDIHVLQGERTMARDNKTIGKFRLKGIRRAPAGVPQIEVTFDIDTNGILRVSAKDLDTGKEQGITISADDRMSDEEIRQAMMDAAQYASQDTLRKEALEVSSQSNQLLNQANRLLKEKKDMDKEAKKELKNAIANMQKQLGHFRVDKISEQELSDLKFLKDKLEETINRV